MSSSPSLVTADPVRRRLRAAGATFAWAWRSALSRGESFEPTPRGRHLSASAVRGYILDFTEKTRAPGAQRPSDLLPADLAQLALGWWERSLDGESGADQRFLTTCELLLEQGRRDGDRLVWLYDVAVPKYGLRAPWPSALAQGQAASVFVRAHAHFGDERFAEAALSALELLIDPGSPLVTTTASGPVLEEAPSTPPSHILNGWIQALGGLWDAGLALEDAAATRAFQEGVRTLESHLPAYDVGWWTRYSLYPHPIDDLAKPIYQRLHADLVDALAFLTGNDVFARTAKRWRAYDRAVPRTLAVAQKAVFALVDGRSRRTRTEAS